ncbi:MAG TPA: cyclopropane-fatty-acyl-phospholipid synthase family protein [Candidatus Acidoferrales bacterium]
MIDRLAKTLLMRGLQGLRGGSLEIIDGERTHWFGEYSHALRATIVVHHQRFFRRVLLQGEIGAGDSYMDGDWSSPDLVALVQLAVRNIDRIESSHWPMSALGRWKNFRFHLGRKNTVRGSKANIAHHYDLGNEFYRLFLDRNLIYSCGVFRDPEDTLEAAQNHKLSLICERLGLAPGDHVLEIGTGWGGFALYASQMYGCRVTTTTISEEQYRYAKSRFARAGKAGERITLLRQDYRKLAGQYDKIASIEMFEAVGLAHYDDFFAACDRLLVPGGAMCLQTITMNDRRFHDYVRNCDWIQKRIFPGAELASVPEILFSLARSTKMRLAELEEIGLHYAETLKEWRLRFLGQLDRVKHLGFDDQFARMWEYYLAYCEGAFREQYIGDVQLLLRKSGTAKGTSTTRPLETYAPIPGTIESHPRFSDSQ